MGGREVSTSLSMSKIEAAMGVEEFMPPQFCRRHHRCYVFSNLISEALLVRRTIC